MCNLDVLQKYLKDSAYFEDEYEEALWESDHIVKPFCAAYGSCHECPWNYVQVIVPHVLLQDLKKLVNDSYLAT